MGMYKVCFADDEIRNHKVWENLISWPEKGFMIVGTAADGQEALDLFLQEKPDLMLIDIKMPIIDGLECIRRIREISSSVKLVLVTAFSEFEFARQAIEYRVGGYLLKPVNRAALSELVDKVRSELNLEQEQTAEFRTLREEQYAAELMLALQSLTSNRDSHNDLDILWRRPILLGDFFFYGSNKLCLAAPEIEKALHTLEEALACRHASPLARLSVSQGQTLMALPARRGLLEELPFVIELFQSQGIICNAYLLNEPILPENLERIKNCLKETGDRSFYKVCGSLDPLLESPGSGSGELFTERDKCISAALEQQSPEPLKKCIEQELQNAAGQNIPPWLAKEACFELLEQLKVRIHKICPVDNPGILDGINLSSVLQIPKLGPLCDLMDQVIGDAFSRLRSMEASHEYGNAARVLRINAYSGSHFQECNFSVQRVAEQVGLSKNYLTKIYKEATGIGFWEYITNLRMEKAKQLLRQTEDTLAAIAEAVGYSSEYHFCRKFKVFAGLSPGTYRKNARNIHAKN
jgi:AraC-like DNA-binding protein/DNA-binding NarL/FixJ family response regulator